MKHNRYTGYFREHTKAIIFVILLTIIAKACTFVSAHVISDIIDEISDASIILMNVIQTAVLLLSIEICYATASFVSSRKAESVKKSVIRRIHIELARKIADSSPKTVRQNEAVELSEKMREGNNLVEGVYGVFYQIFAVLLGIAALIYTFVCSHIIFVMFLLFFALILTIQYFVIKSMRNKRKEVSKASDSSKKLLVEILKGFPDVKSLSMIGGLKTHFISALDNEYDLGIQSANLIIRNEFWTNLILAVYKCAFLIVSAWVMLSGDITKANFIALFMYRNYVYGLVNSVLQIVRNKAQISASAERMNEIFEYQSVEKEQYGDVRLYPVVGDLSVEGLTTYYDDFLALDNVSFTIPAGKFVAIVGKKGCGKSTLLNVLARQESYTSGTITIDGHNMLDLDEWTYHKAFAHVPQFPFLFSMSIKDNLLLANPNASDDDIYRALDECSALDFVKEKGGLDVVLEPSQLSGGQRQCLALARLALRGGRIIMLDESTSALDTVSQNEIVTTIKKATDTGHTVLLISHRAAPLRKADSILYMEKGRIVAQGTYDELYNSNDNFRELIDLG